jgi:hypothetical protein
MNKTLTLLTIVLATAATSFAGTAVADSKKVVVPPVQEDLFRANEWQVDAFVAGAAGRFNHQNYNGVGGGLGASYFFTRYFGVGVDDTLGSLNGNGKTYDNLQGNLIGRLPIESWHLAPYALVGGGSTWGNHAAQGNGNVGLGVEYRINRSFGLFVDSRYIYGSSNLSETLSRGGIRFAF